MKSLNRNWDTTPPAILYQDNFPKVPMCDLIKIKTPSNENKSHDIRSYIDSLSSFTNHNVKQLEEYLFSSKFNASSSGLSKNALVQNVKSQRLQTRKRFKTLILGNISEDKKIQLVHESNGKSNEKISAPSLFITSSHRHKPNQRDKNFSSLAKPTKGLRKDIISTAETYKPSKQKKDFKFKSITDLKLIAHKNSSPISSNRLMPIVIKTPQIKESPSRTGFNFNKTKIFNLCNEITNECLMLEKVNKLQISTKVKLESNFKREVDLFKVLNSPKKPKRNNSIVITKDIKQGVTCVNKTSMDLINFGESILRMNDVEFSHSGNFLSDKYKSYQSSACLTQSTYSINNNGASKFKIRKNQMHIKRLYEASFRRFRTIV